MVSVVSFGFYCTTLTWCRHRHQCKDKCLAQDHCSKLTGGSVMKPWPCSQRTICCRTQTCGEFSLPQSKGSCPLRGKLFGDFLVTQLQLPAQNNTKSEREVLKVWHQRSAMHWLPSAQRKISGAGLPTHSPDLTTKCVCLCVWMLAVKLFFWL